MSFNSIKEIAEKCKAQNINFYEAILEDDISERQGKRSESIDSMQKIWKAMYEAGKNYEGNKKSSSGLVGGDGEKFEKYAQEKRSICGDFTSRVISEAIKMGESNACMKRIVAAPTAGSCGVLPAVLIPLYEERNISEEKIIEALYVSAGIGQVIATRAYIAGAAGGCQAEIGAAASMAAAALVYIQGGSNEMIMNAAAIALKNLLGLVCDPVAGLVEVPCVKRNVIGAMSAISAADMALAGIESKIPADEVIDAMKDVGDLLNESLRETGRGGLAATKTAVKIVQSLNNK